VKFKLDENLGVRTQKIIRDAGHDIQTVYEEAISGISDDQLFSFCQNEQRVLLTLDLDFANVLRFPPEKTEGIVVIRLPRNPSLPLLEQLVRQFLLALEQIPIENKLWIVELGRVRVHQSDTETE
jgi:predicted nuclease of predicted toxin-antitoxin system